jgi:hypothetical protein
MANQGAATIILIASLLVAVALSGVDARLTAVRHNAAAALRGAKANARLIGHSTRLTVRRDTNGGMQLHTPTYRPSNHPA